MGVVTPLPALPQLASIAGAILRRADGTTFAASTLWASQPQVVLVLRRPGCVLCRDEAQKLWAVKPQLEKLGFGVTCVVHEWIDKEINAFAAGFWPGPIFHDTDKAFYKALNDGTILRASIVGLLNPFSAEWKRIAAASKNVKEHNVIGNGLVSGGVMIVRQGEGGVAWSHLETQLGLVPSPEEVLAQAQQVASEGGAKAAAAVE